MRSKKIGAYFVILLTLIFSFNSPESSGGIFPNASTVQVGGRVFTDLNNIIILWAPVHTSGRYTTFRKMGASSGYQVTAGKTLHIYALKSTVAIASGNGEVNILQGDSDIGYDSASAPTNPVFPGAFASNLTDNALLQVAQAAGGAYENLPENGGIDFPIAAAKYASMVATGTSVSVIAYAYEF